jgi:DNA-binding NtrC family response regulator
MNARAQLFVPRIRVCIVSGADTGAVCVSESGKLAIGACAGADLVLTDPAVSQFHCELEAVRDRVLVRDLGSSNGTRLDGVSILAAHALHGSVLELGRTRAEIQISQDRIEVPLADSTQFGKLVGAAPCMRRIFADLRRAAEAEVTVFVCGETGTGTRAAAESIHEHSARHGKPFVVIDCSAHTPDVLEGELFGRGRRPTNDRSGALRAAHGGTLLLDEVGDLDGDLQYKLLAALQRQPAMDVRVVAASRRDVRADINRRRFRPDVYQRLAAISVRMPPLRDRMDDIPLLTAHLLASLGHSPDPALDRELRRRSWPGNVRELRSFLERHVAPRERTIAPASARRK